MRLESYNPIAADNRAIFNGASISVTKQFFRKYLPNKGATMRPPPTKWRICCCKDNHVIIINGEYLNSLNLQEWSQESSEWVKVVPPRPPGSEDWSVMRPTLSPLRITLYPASTYTQKATNHSLGALTFFQRQWWLRTCLTHSEFPWRNGRAKSRGIFLWDSSSVSGVTGG